MNLIVARFDLMTAPLVSVIVPTYNGKEKVITLLHALEKQHVSMFEVLVVIDGSSDNTLQEIESQSWNLHALKLIEQENKGRAGARNTGAAAAASQQLLFFDDDMLPDADCIGHHVAFYKEHATAVAMGRINEPATATDPEIKKYKDYLNTLWSSSLKPYNQQALPKNKTALSAANFSISKQLYASMGGFDEALKDIEDYDFALRIKTKDILVYYLDNAVAIHNDSFTFRKYAQRSKAYLKNRLLAASLKPELYANDPILSHKKSVTQRLVYAIFRYPFWLTMLDSFNICRIFLPEKLRYKLYGVIITAYVHNQ
jgi:glycosyltransferase involved in cell wall biosynthesis